MTNRIIIIDDEQDFLDTVRRGLIIAGFKEITRMHDPHAAARLFEGGDSFDVALIDITMPEMNGVDLLKLIKNTSPDTECIMVTALNEAQLAVNCMKNGAYDYLVKPIRPDELILTLNRALERKRLLDVIHLGKTDAIPGTPLKNASAFSPIVTQSETIRKIILEAELHALSDVPVLITGDSGTGKELLAKSIHLASARSDAGFLAINMASLSASLFDSEFFGHTKGAFTGAGDDRKGYLESTHKGSLFLDEIGHLPMDLQGKLLRVLQEGEFVKLGKSAPQAADVRVIAATNADLNQLMARGKFRKDLYYRLKGAWLHLPRLKKRKGDIHLLIHHFLGQYGSPQTTIESDALAILQSYDYPGNIRELSAIIRSALNLCKGKPISVHHLPPDILKKASPPKKTDGAAASLKPLSEIEKCHIAEVYRQTNKNKSRTARILGIGLNTLRRKLVSYGIET